MEFVYRNTSVAHVTGILQMSITSGSTPGKLNRKLFQTDALYGGISGSTLWLKRTSYYSRNIPQRHFQGIITEQNNDVVISGDFRHSQYSIIGSMVSFLTVCILWFFLNLHFWGSFQNIFQSKFFYCGVVLFLVGAFGRLGMSASMYRKEEAYVIDFLKNQVPDMLTAGYNNSPKI